MAGSLSTDLSNKLLDHTFKTTPFVVPTNVYVSLYSVVPTKAGGGTEISGNGYARVLMNVWDVAAAGATENTNVITFAAVTGSAWPEAVAYGLFDAITGGNFLGFGDLTVPKTAQVGDVVEVPVGDIDITIDA